MTLVIIIACVMINYAISPATIVIHSKIEEKEAEINLTIDTKASKPDFETWNPIGKNIESQRWK